MKYSSKQILLLLLAQTCVIGVCSAQTNDLKKVFHAADTNQDGKISLEEFKEHARQSAFDNMDKDHDKKVDRQEWGVADRSPQAEQNFQAADKNTDKSVSFLEFSRRADKNYNYDEVFNTLDRNRDGSLAPDEFNARPAFNIFTIKF